MSMLLMKMLTRLLMLLSSLLLPSLFACLSRLSLFAMLVLLVCWLFTFL